MDSYPRPGSRPQAAIKVHRPASAPIDTTHTNTIPSGHSQNPTVPKTATRRNKQRIRQAHRTRPQSCQPRPAPPMATMSSIDCPVSAVTPQISHISSSSSSQKIMFYMPLSGGQAHNVARQTVAASASKAEFEAQSIVPPQTTSTEPAARHTDTKHTEIFINHLVF